MLIALLNFPEVKPSGNYSTSYFNLFQVYQFADKAWFKIYFYRAIRLMIFRIMLAGIAATAQLIYVEKNDKTELSMEARGNCAER